MEKDECPGTDGDHKERARSHSRVVAPGRTLPLLRRRLRFRRRFDLALGARRLDFAPHLRGALGGLLVLAIDDRLLIDGPLLEPGLVVGHGHHANRRETATAL